MTKKILAIEFGAETLKIAVLHQAKGTYNVEAYNIISLSEKAYDLDGGLNINEIKPSLDEALQTLKAGKLPVALTVNAKNKIVRTRDLPLCPLKELEGIVKFEAEQFLPYGIDQFYVDFRVIGEGTLTTDGSDKEKVTTEAAKVMIAALPKETLNQYLELLNQSGCKIQSVTLHTDAVYTYAKQHFQTSGQAIIMCDLGANSINTILMENQEFLADINSDSGTKSIIDHFSIKHGLDTQQSAACLFGREDITLSKTENEMDQLYKKIEKLNQFVSSDLQDQRIIDAQESAMTLGQEPETKKSYTASDAIRESASELYGDIGKEISRMMEFYRTRRFGTRVNRIYIFGGGAELLGLKSYLKQRLDINDIQCVSETASSGNFANGDLNLMVAAIGGAIGR